MYLCTYVYIYIYIYIQVTAGVGRGSEKGAGLRGAAQQSNIIIVYIMI